MKEQPDKNEAVHDELAKSLWYAELAFAALVQILEERQVVSGDEVTARMLKIVEDDGGVPPDQTDEKK